MDLEALRQTARRAQALAIGAREDVERCERTLEQLKRKAIIASQAHWNAQIALERAEAAAAMRAAA